jgi:uncharacterized membrane protein
MRRLLRRAWTAPLLVVALAACSKEKDPNAHTAAPDVASNFGGPLDARGSDPNWGLTVRGTTLTLSRDGQPDLSIIVPGAVIQPHTATWTGALPNGQPVKVTFYTSSCFNLASGQTFPFAAEVDLPDSSPLTGCGGPPGGKPGRSRP